MFFTHDGARWWCDVKASSAERVKEQAEKQGYQDVVVYAHQGARF